MAITVEGFVELAEQIERMANALDTDAGGAALGRKLLKEAAKPIHEQMKTNTSSDPKMISGDLHNALKIGKVRKRRNGG